MSEFAAECDACGTIATGDRETVGDAVEAHDDWHDVQVQRVATDGGVDAVPEVPIEDLPDIPECRITATADPAGMLRFEMTRDRADAVREQVQATIDDAPADADELLDLVIILDYPAYASLTKGLAELHQTDEIAAKQVRVEPADEPDVALSVVVNASQIESSMRKNYATIQQYGRGQVYGQRFGVSRNGLVMLDQQLGAALDGHDDPVEAIDTDDDRLHDPDVATDGGQVQACPECGSSRIRKQGSRSVQCSWDGEAYTCEACGARFEEPATRASERGGGPRNGLANDLYYDHDAGDLVTDGGRDTYAGDTERRARCPCGWQTGWFDPDDATTLAEKHARRCNQASDLTTLEYKEREKNGQNYSDTIEDLGPPNPCDNCGADNVQGQVMCAVCGGMVTEV
jgi:predicted RNA-binding Zn-ribbon protein involved in translation (DUF1610 family)